MNLSASAITDFRERQGSAKDDRPDYVHDALTHDKQLGHGNGLPLVPPPSGDTDVKLGESTDQLYQHYPETPLSPGAGNFLSRLLDSDYVRSIPDAADELGCDTETVETACELHGLTIDDSQATESDSDSGLRLPSGETISYDYLDEQRPWADKAVLWQVLAQDGLSIEEAARYFSHVTDDRVTSDQVRQAAREAKLLEPDEHSSKMREGGYPTRQNIVNRKERSPVDFR